MDPLPTVTPPDVTHDVVFYDGRCGLCHWSVRFMLKRDKAGVFRFAPQDSETMRRTFTAELRGRLPDSVVIVTREGRVLVRSESTVYVLKSLPRWRWVGAVLGAVPRGIADALYDFIARTRYRLFKRPEAACPMVPEALRGRFLS